MVNRQDDVVLAVRGLSVTRPGSVRRTRVPILQDVDLICRAYQTVALIGESGAGKTTLARAVLRVIPVDDGTIWFRGVDLTKLRPRTMRPLRRWMGSIFQDAGQALDPRMAVGTLIEEPLTIHHLGNYEQRQRRVREMMDRVGLATSLYSRMPGELSGGQQQRVGIARALASAPELIVADEPLSALDAVTRFDVVDLLQRIQRDTGVSYLLIGHDLRSAETIAHQTAVLYQGRIVEQAPTSVLWASPYHPYSQALLNAVPRVGRPWAVPLPVATESAVGIATCCAYARHCPRVQPRCRVERPLLREVLPGHQVACHFPGTSQAMSTSMV